MGVHQEFAGCLVRLGGDAAYRPAGGYVERRAAAPRAGAGGAEPRAPALPARASVPRWTGSLLPRARDLLLEIPQSKLHDHTFNIKHQSGKTPRHGPKCSHWKKAVIREPAGRFCTAHRFMAILDFIEST